MLADALQRSPSTTPGTKWVELQATGSASVELRVVSVSAEGSRRLIALEDGGRIVLTEQLCL